MGLVFRDDSLVVKQTFITQATQTHTGAHHDQGSPEVRAQNRGLTQGHTENRRPGPRCREQGAQAAGGPGSLQAGNEGQCGGRGPEEAGLDGRRPRQGGKATRGATGEAQQSHRMKRATQKEGPPQSRDLRLEKVTLAAKVSLTEEAREDARRQSPDGRPWAVRTKAPYRRRSQPSPCRLRPFSELHWLV